MSNNSRWRTDRYSRAPSLSTIDSNEETNFSSHHHAHQTARSESPISPFYPNDQNRYSTVSPLEDRTEYNQTDPKRQSIYSSRELHNQRGGGPEQFNHTLDGLNLPPPDLAFLKTADDEMPPRRTGTSGSLSSVESGGGGVKYMKTRYMWMLLQLDQIPWWHNALAALSAWLVLAAYLVLPGTFTSLQSNGTFGGTGSTNSTTPNPASGVEKGFDDFVKNGISHVPLLVLSAAFAGFGALSCMLLFLLHWQNYVWLSWKIFQPMTLNALAGLLSTVVNVYTQHGGKWSPSATINAIITGGVAVIAGLLLLIYNVWLLGKVKEDHRRYFPVDAELIDPMKKNRFGRYLPGSKY